MNVARATVPEPAAAPATGDSTVRVVRSVSEIREIAPRWRALQSTPGSDLDQYLVNLDADPSIVRPHVVVVGRNGSSAAMAAGRIEETRLQMKIGYQRIWRPKVRCLAVEPGAVCGDLSYANCIVLVRSLYEALRRGEADILVLRELRRNSSLHRLAQTVPPFFCRDGRPDGNVRWVISLPESRGGSMPLSAHTRKHLRYYSNRLRRKYSSVRVERYDAPSDLDRLIEDVEAVACKTYQRQLGVGFVPDEATRRRFRFQMEHGWFRSFVLYVADRPCAFRIGFAYGDTYYAGDTGYDPALREDRVGELLLQYSFDAVWSEPRIRYFDFGFGDAEYKKRYSSERFEDVTMVVFAPTPRGVFLNAARATIGGTNRMLKSVAARLRILEPLRTRLRRRMVRANDAEPVGANGRLPWAKPTEERSGTSA